MPKVGSGPVSKPTELEWEQAEVVIRDKQARPHKVDVLRLGNLAVHPSLEEEFKDHWTLTHLPTGMYIIHLLGDEHVIQVAEVFSRKFQPALKGDTQQLVQARLSAWVKRWILAMRKAKTFIGPESYQGG